MREGLPWGGTPLDPLPDRGEAFADYIERLTYARAELGRPPVEGLPPVIACRTLIADTVAQLPLVAMRGGQPRVDQPPLLTQPDPQEPRWSTLHRIAMHLSGRGNAWLLILAWGADDRPMAVRALDPAEVAAELDELGAVTEVRWHDRRLQVGVDVLHIPLISSGAAGGLGRSPLDLARVSLDGLASLYGYASSYWSGGGNPSVLLKVPHRVSRDEAEAVRAQWLETHGGRRVPAVLWGGAEAEPFAASAEQAQLTQAHAQATAEIARLFRIPPSLVNAQAGDSLTYSTTAEQMRSWLATGLAPYLMRIEAAFSELLPRGTVARHDTAELLRADWRARVDGYAVALGGAPWLTVDEVRDQEGRPPITAGALPRVTEPAATGL